MCEWSSLRKSSWIEPSLGLETPTACITSHMSLSGASRYDCRCRAALKAPSECCYLAFVDAGSLLVHCHVNAYASSWAAEVSRWKLLLLRRLPELSGYPQSDVGHRHEGTILTCFSLLCKKPWFSNKANKNGGMTMTWTKHGGFRQAWRPQPGNLPMSWNAVRPPRWQRVCVRWDEAS